MNSLFGHLGPMGLAVVLTVLLIVGIPGGGKLRPLGWWPTLILSMLAGSAYKAAGGPFKFVPSLVGSLIHTTQGFAPGLTMPALALALGIVILFKKLTTKHVGYLGIAFWYVAAGAGGMWSYVSDSIAHLGVSVS